LVSIKHEEQDVSMISSLNDLYPPSSFPPFSACSNVLQEDFHDRILSSRARSASSSILPNSSTSFPQYTIKNPLSVQPSTKQTRKQNSLPNNEYEQSRMTQFHSMGNSQIFPNSSTPIQHYDDKFRKSISSENYAQNRQVLNIRICIKSHRFLLKLKKSNATFYNY
jgi:hypothetical protein